jgi:hypothetical protein
VLHFHIHKIKPLITYFRNTRASHCANDGLGPEDKYKLGREMKRLSGGVGQQTMVATIEWNAKESLLFD